MDDSNDKNKGRIPWGLQLPKKRHIVKTSFNSSTNKQAQNEDIKSSPELSPSPFLASELTVTDIDYDSLLMSTKVETKTSKTDHNMKPRYMDNIMRRVQERKLEKERQLSLRAQTEYNTREEQFITRAYKKRLDEISQLERRFEEEKSAHSKPISMTQFYKELLDKNYRSRRNNQ